MRSILRPAWLPAALALVVVAAPASRADDFRVEEGYESLFNGKDLTGWHVGPESLDGKTESADGRFKARDGVLLIQGAAKIEDVYTTREFGRDFVLKLEFRASPRANSGLHLRRKQLQVRDYPTVGPYKDLKHFKPGDWNAVEVVVKGDKARCTCNGELLEEALSLPAKGPIGLQSETNTLEYRRIRIKEQP